jgi:hypothetical protein
MKRKRKVMKEKFNFLISVKRNEKRIKVKILKSCFPIAFVYIFSNFFIHSYFCVDGSSSFVQFGWSASKFWFVGFGSFF